MTKFRVYPMMCFLFCFRTTPFHISISVGLFCFYQVPISFNNTLEIMFACISILVFFIYFMHLKVDDSGTIFFSSTFSPHMKLYMIDMFY